MPVHPHAAPPAGERGDSTIRTKLLRAFGLGFGIAVVVGGVVGSGILRNPGVVAAGFVDAKWIMLAWLFGGFIVAVDAMPTVELGAAIPQSGGPYPLAARALGPFLGFLVGWSDWLQIAVSTGFMAVAFGEYIQRLGFLGGLTIGEIAMLMVLLCGALNWSGTKVAGFSQNIGSALKALVLLILVVALFTGHPNSRLPDTPPPNFSWVAMAVALRAIYGTYGGWQAAVYFSEEVHQPGKNVARATFLGIGLVTLIYVTVNAAVLYVLPIGILATSTLAVADAAKVALGDRSSQLVTGLAVICVATIANLQIMEHVRCTFSMARNGVLPPGLARLSKSGAPRASLFIVIIATVLIIAGADLAKGQLYEILLNIYAPLAAVVFLLLGLAAMRFRAKAADVPRPWKMPFYPWPALLSVLLNGGLLLLFLVADWKTGLCAALLIVAMLPMFFYGRSRWPAKHGGKIE